MHGSTCDWKDLESGDCVKRSLCRPFAACGHVLLPVSRVSAARGDGQPLPALPRSPAEQASRACLF